MPTDQAIALIEHRLTSMEASHDDLRDAIKELTVAINKLAIIDERQVQSALILDRLSNSVEKAHARIDGLQNDFARALERAKEECHSARSELEKRLIDLEKSEPLQKKTTEWVDKVQWLIVGTVITGIVALVLTKPGA